MIAALIKSPQMEHELDFLVSSTGGSRGQASKDQIATHSIRKFIIDFLLSILDGPNVCAVYIRAGWSLGNTQDRYIVGGAGEDNLIGR